jgi:GTP pyrophosphokinase
MKTPERWIDVDWEEKRDEKQKHVARIRLLLMNSQGALAATTTAISRQAGNISHVKTTSYDGDFFEMTMDIEVKNATHLSSILAELRSMSIVSSVERI